MEHFLREASAVADTLSDSHTDHFMRVAALIGHSLDEDALLLNEAADGLSSSTAERVGSYMTGAVQHYFHGQLSDDELYAVKAYISEVLEESALSALSDIELSEESAREVLQGLQSFLEGSDILEEEGEEEGETESEDEIVERVGLKIRKRALGGIKRLFRDAKRDNGRADAGDAAKKASAIVAALENPGRARLKMGDLVLLMTALQELLPDFKNYIQVLSTYGISMVAPVGGEEAVREHRDWMNRNGIGASSLTYTTAAGSDVVQVSSDGGSSTENAVLVELLVPGSAGVTLYFLTDTPEYGVLTGPADKSTGVYPVRILASGRKAKSRNTFSRILRTLRPNTNNTNVVRGTVYLAAKELQKLDKVPTTEPPSEEEEEEKPSVTAADAPLPLLPLPSQQEAEALTADERQQEFEKLGDEYSRIVSELWPQGATAFVKDMKFRYFGDTPMLPFMTLEKQFPAIWESSVLMLPTNKKTTLKLKHSNDDDGKERVDAAWMLALTAPTTDSRKVRMLFALAQPKEFAGVLKGSGNADGTYSEKTGDFEDDFTDEEEEKLTAGHVAVLRAALKPLAESEEKRWLSDFLDRFYPLSDEEEEAKQEEEETAPAGQRDLNSVAKRLWPEGIKSLADYTERLGLSDTPLRSLTPAQKAAVFRAALEDLPDSEDKRWLSDFLDERYPLDESLDVSLAEAEEERGVTGAEHPYLRLVRSLWPEGAIDFVNANFFDDITDLPRALPFTTKELRAKFPELWKRVATLSIIDTDGVTVKYKDKNGNDATTGAVSLMITAPTANGPKRQLRYSAGRHGRKGSLSSTQNADGSYSEIESEDAIATNEELNDGIVTVLRAALKQLPDSADKTELTEYLEGHLSSEWTLPFRSFIESIRFRGALEKLYPEAEARLRGVHSLHVYPMFPHFNTGGILYGDIDKKHNTLTVSDVKTRMTTTTEKEPFDAWILTLKLKNRTNRDQNKLYYVRNTKHDDDTPDELGRFNHIDRVGEKLYSPDIPDSTFGYPAGLEAIARDAGISARSIQDGNVALIRAMLSFELPSPEKTQILNILTEIGFDESAAETAPPSKPLPTPPLSKKAVDTRAAARQKEQDKQLAQMKSAAINYDSPVMLEACHTGASDKVTYKRARDTIGADAIDLGDNPFVAHPKSFILRINGGKQGWAIPFAQFDDIIETLYPRLIKSLEREETYLMKRGEGVSHSLALRACNEKVIREDSMRQLAEEEEKQKAALEPEMREPELAELIEKVAACELTPLAALKELPSDTVLRLHMPALGIDSSAALEDVIKRLGSSVLNRKPVGPFEYQSQERRYMQHPVAVLLEIGDAGGLLAIPTGDYQEQLNSTFVPLGAREIDYLVLKALGKSDDFYKSRAAKGARKLTVFDFARSADSVIAKKEALLKKDPSNSIAQSTLKEYTRRRAAANYISPCPPGLAARAKGDAAPPPRTVRDYLIKHAGVVAPAKGVLPAGEGVPTTQKARTRSTLDRIRKYFCKNTDFCPPQRRPTAAPSDCAGGVCPFQKKSGLSLDAMTQQSIGAELSSSEDSDAETLVLCTSLCKAALVASIIAAHLEEGEEENEEEARVGRALRKSSKLRDISALQHEVQELYNATRSVYDKAVTESLVLQALGKRSLSLPKDIKEAAPPERRRSITPDSRADLNKLLTALKNDKKQQQKQLKEMVALLEQLKSMQSGARGEGDSLGSR